MLSIRTIMSLVIVLFTAQVLQAQWQGTNPVYFNTGNVGIGTDMPSYKLDVRGSAFFGNTTGTNFTTIDANGNLGIGTQPYTNIALSIKRNANLSAGIRFENSSSGNAAFAIMQMGQDYGSTARFLNILYASSGIGNYGVYQQNGSTIYNNGSGGLNFGTSAGFIRFFAGGVTDGFERMRINENGNLGINTASPAEKLDVNGNIKATGFILPTGAAAGKLLTSDANGNATWQTASGWAYGGNAVTALTKIGTTNNNSLPFITNNIERMRIDAATGNVGIGTVNINDVSYKLYVEAGIRTRKVKVDQVTWADYVFHPTYKLRPLRDLEQFISVNHHLPEVPSADEVQKNGLDLGDNQAVLLKKIEELTMYLIDVNKKVERLEQDLKKQAQSKQQ